MADGFEHADALVRAITAHSPDVVFAKDRAGRLTFLNPAGRALLGDDSLGRTIHDLPIPDEQKALVAANDERIMASGAAEVVEERYDTRMFQSSKSPLRDQAGQVIGLVGIARDITGLHEQAAALRRSEEHFRAMADDLPLIVWMHDAEGRQQFVNRTFCEYFGMPRDAARDDRWRVLTHPDDGSAYAEEFFRCVRAREPFHGVVRVRRADGQWRTLESWARPRFDASGAYLGHVGTSADVTEAHEALAALHRKEQELQRLADNSPDIVARLDRDLRHVFINAAIERAGLSPTALIGRTHREAGLPEAMCRLFESAAREAIANGAARHLAFTFESPDGPRHYEARLIPERDGSGETTHLLGITQDVTEARRLTEEREHLLAAERTARVALQREAGVRDEFLATLSHELRTPLNAIVGWVALLRRAPADTARIAQGLEVIARNAEAQVRLVDELLDVNRMLAGKLKLTTQSVDINAAVRAAADTVGPATVSRAIGLHLHLSPNLPHVNADPHRLQQIAWNLLSNAVKFTPTGGDVIVATRRDADAVVISVRDTGEGLDPDFIAHAFDRFRQADGSASRRHAGLGLGLAISRQLVELHGGTIEAFSQGRGQGSEFVVRLPLTAATAAASTFIAAPPDDHGTPLTSTPVTVAPVDVDVLVVDDQPDALDLCARVLGEAGARVRTATSATAALDAILQQKPDVLVSDIGMPDMDGYALLRHVRQQLHLGPQELPAVAVSAFSRPEDRGRAFEAGYQEFLVKPLSLHALTSTVAGLAVTRPPVDAAGERSDAALSSDGASR